MTDAYVLWLTRWAPYAPLRGGDIDHSRNLIESLAKRTPVHGLVFRSAAEPPALFGLSWATIDAGEPHRAFSLGSSLPNVAFRHSDPAYFEAAVKAARGARVIVVDFIGLFGLVEPLKRRLEAELGDARPPIVLFDHNHEHAIRKQMVAAERGLPMKALLAVDTFKAGRLERSALRAADAAVSVTAADAAALGAISGKPVLPSTPGYSGPVASHRLIDAQTPRRLVIIGGHEATHKRMVLERALAALDAKGVQHQAIVDVVGPGAAGPLEKRYQGFNFIGYVDDLTSYVATARLGLIPDEIGGGFKHRALTHAFLRLPMLAVEQALDGMGFVAAMDYAGAPTMIEAAAMATLLLDDFERLNAMQEAAFARCQGSFDWATRGSELEAFLAKAVRSRQSS